MSSNLLGPMPDTSRSWSTDSNRPCAVRQSTMRWARTGPTPGRPSNCSRLAVFRSTGADPDAEPAEPPAPAGIEDPPAVGAPETPTAICSPSVSLRARFSELRSTPGSAPPAARSASSTRDALRRRYTPGWRTLPTTSTTTTEAGDPEAEDGADNAGVAAAGGDGG